MSFNNPTKGSIFVLFLCLPFVFESCGEPCENRRGKELIQFTYSFDVDSIKIEQGDLFNKTEFDQGVLYNSDWKHIEHDSVAVIVYINSIATRMSFAVESNKFLYIVLTDASGNVCETGDPVWHLLERGNAEACFYYETVNCP